MMKVEIYIYNNYSQIFGHVPQEVIQACTLKRGFFTRKKGDKKAKYNIKYYSYLNKRNQKFPTGWLFSKVVPVYKELGYEVSLIDCRKKIEYRNLNAKFDTDMVPRDYQLEAKQSILKKERGIINHATGSGKTFTAALFLNEVGVNTLYIVPTQLLLYQTADTFSRWFGKDRVGVIGDGNWEPSLITIATNQTLWSNIKSVDFAELISQTECLIVDEAHFINKQTKANKALPGNTFYIIAQKFENARLRVAFTATPGTERSYGGMLLRAATGKILHKVTSSDLIKTGILSKPKVVIYDHIIDVSFDNWQEAYRENIVDNPERNRKIVDIAKQYANQGKRVLIAVNYVEKHGKVLESMFSEDASVEALYGEHKTKYRKEVLQRFKNAETRILISSIVKVGVDIPEMDVVIIANAGKGGEEHKQLIQLLGRVLRKTESKNKATIIDFYDRDSSILEKHSKLRLDTYRKEDEFQIVRR